MYYFDLPPARNKILTLSTELKEPSPIYFGHDIQSQLADYLSRLTFDKLFVFCDEIVYSIHGENLYRQLAARYPRCELIIIHSGEHSKSFDVLENLCDDLIQRGVSKQSILISLGGGALGNLVGMASGLVYRGVRFMEVPTTLTGQTDSILSNKQAVNGKYGKNHFGFYHAPVLLWVDTKYLMTEPLKSRRSGLIEAVKNGFISDPDFLAYLEPHLKKDSNYTEEELYSLAYNIIISKLHILRRDPTEKHEAIILEYGHTFGHAIEWLAAANSETSIQHGEAVAIGMKIAAELSYALGYLDEKARDLHYYVIEEKVGTNVKLPPWMSADKIIQGMEGDNKKTGREIRFVLLEEIGKCLNPQGDYLVHVDLELVRDVLQSYIQGVHSHRYAA
jgi:3-dehydroquinate synthetase